MSYIIIIDLINFLRFRSGKKSQMGRTVQKRIQNKIRKEDISNTWK